MTISVMKADKVNPISLKAMLSARAADLRPKSDLPPRVGAFPGIAMFAKGAFDSDCCRVLGSW
jgi:hypothetical protein